MSNDRRTTIYGDQIEDGTIQKYELNFENSATEDSLVSVNQSTGNFKYKSFPVFGQNFNEASSLDLSTTTATSFQQKMRMTTETLPIGKYRLGWSYSWQYEKTSSSFNGRIQINDIDTTMTHTEIPANDDASIERYCTGFLYFSLTSEQTLNIDLDYCGNTGKEAMIFNARLEIWRVL